MSYQLIKSPEGVVVVPFSRESTVDRLGAMVYRLHTSDNKLVLVPVKERFNSPNVLLGENKEQLELLKNHHDEHGKVTALFIGLKGSGKTTTAEAFCNYAMSKDIPVFLIDGNTPPSAIELAISICHDQECCLLFDEFDSNYPYKQDNERHTQLDLLSMFSDSSKTKVSFLLTGNDIEKFASALISRPGRFKYRFIYSDISNDMLSLLFNRNGLSGEAAIVVSEFCKQKTLSFDSASTLISCIKGCKTVSEIMEKIKWLNVPNEIFMYPEITSVAVVDGLVGLYEASIVYNSDESETRYRVVIKQNGVVIYTNLHSFDSILDDMYLDLGSVKLSLSIRIDFEGVRVYSDRHSRILSTKSTYVKDPEVDEKKK